MSPKEEPFIDIHAALKAKFRDIQASQQSVKDIQASLERIENKLKDIKGDSTTPINIQKDLDAIKRLSECLDVLDPALFTKAEHIQMNQVKLTVNDAADACCRSLSFIADGNITYSTKNITYSTNTYHNNMAIIIKELKPYIMHANSQMAKSYKRITEELETKNKAFEKLNKSINDLLPGAISAGLASAFSEEKRSLKRPIVFHSIVFYCSIILLSVTSYFFIIHPLSDISNISKMMSLFLYKLPMAIPIIWLVLYSSQRRSEAQRLYHEYLHKETMARSYVAFAEQIKELNVSEDLIKKLMDSTISVIAENPSATLNKRHKQKTLLQELMLSKKNKS